MDSAGQQRLLPLLAFGVGLAFSAVSAPVAGQTCGCSHQGASVDCPAHLPAGSRSVQFVSGGTMWETPDGQNVFVPQATFSCGKPSAPALLAPQTHGEQDAGEHKHQQTEDVLHFLGHQLKHHHHDPSPSALKEDPAVSCYRHVQAAVSDSHGAVHNDNLYCQLSQAAGIQNARPQPACGTQPCQSPAYDCAGVFYDGDGRAVRVPDFPASATTDADVGHWKASVRDFYLGVAAAPHGERLPPGKAALCSTWAEVHAQARPDPSLVQALDTLQQLGGEQTVGQDRTWLTGIFAAGTAKGCPVPALPPQHDTDSWFVPEQSAREFHREFRDCRQPDDNAVGGCPHPFDAPGGSGNHVNAQPILDASGCGTAATWFIGD